MSWLSTACWPRLTTPTHARYDWGTLSQTWDAPCFGPVLELRITACHCARMRLLNLSNLTHSQVEFDDLARLTYLRACNNESMRLKPVTSDGTFLEFDKQVGWVQIAGCRSREQSGTGQFHPNQSLVLPQSG